MRNLATVALSLLPFLVSYVAASPIYYEPVGIIKRDGGAQLWNESGPSVRDVKQVKTLNCWWAASSLAVLISSQKWVEGMIKYNNGSEMTGLSWPTESSVSVTVWNPNDGSQKTFNAEHEYISQTEDHPLGNWWHDAIGQAARSLAKDGSSIVGITNNTENPDWDPNNGSAKTGLKILTGFETDVKYREFISIDEFFDYCGKASQGTPIIFNTLSKEDVGITKPQLGHSHDYAVFNSTTNQDGERVIWARNSWGSTDAFKLEDVYNNSYMIIHLKDWKVLGGGQFDSEHPNAQANSTVTANTTSSSSVPGVSALATSTATNDTASATSTDTASTGTSTAGTSPTSSSVASSDTLATASATIISKDLPATTGESDISSSLAALKTSASVPSGTSNSVAGSRPSVSGADDGNGNGLTTSSWSWSSTLPSWSSTYSASSILAAAGATNPPLLAAVEVATDGGSEPTSSSSERSESTTPCKRNSPDSMC
ncbi:uncharacterized protein L201_003741 [Kwoniella dendrophila CBS 6074]|uniref:Calpain catalytic domain-containing protein n=1 Tax=Kwoniella dendrophila CBS 6074 TaxID=1295534 RepID=A0AAX4JWB7_9TREE